MNKAAEFIGKVAIPLLAVKRNYFYFERFWFVFVLKIQNGEKKWIALKDRKCVLPVKGIIEIEATLIYTNVKIFSLLRIHFLSFPFFSGGF